MISSSSLRIGATAARNLTHRTASKTSSSTTFTSTTTTPSTPFTSSPAFSPKQVALGAFRTTPLPARGFIAASAAGAAASTTTTTPKTKKTTTNKKMAPTAGTAAGAPKKKATAAGGVTKKAAAAAAAEKKKAAAAKKKAAAAKAAEVAKKKKAAAKKKALTPEEKTKLQVRELKKVALLKEPAKLPEHPWILFIAENTKGTKTGDGVKANLGKIMPELSQAFKALSPLELQRLRDTADQNRAANATAHKSWVESHTAAQVADANRARTQLNRIAKTKHRVIQDARLPKRPTSSFSLFTKERWATGEFSGRPLAEAARTLAAEWKSLPQNQRQHYDDLAKTESEQYSREMENILGHPVGKASPSPSPSSP
ncbi:hypothetical protein SBRCBS47491_001039 [Sporothrix bragantina]|uniref:HMG box domain-containing protein n=1 Tax=Sporothrix bragantina TaxID=671064 RepID=A0ABP0AVQ5_9PEZI